MTNSVPTLRSSVVVYQSRQCIVGSGGVVLLVDTPTKAQSLGLSAFDAIKTDIHYAELAPGEQLRLRVLCDRYGCGASPIREALNQLASDGRSEEHTSELQSLMRISYAVFCLKKKTL